MDSSQSEPLSEAPPTSSTAGQLRQRKGKMVPHISSSHYAADSAPRGGTMAAGSSPSLSQFEMSLHPASHSRAPTETILLNQDSGRGRERPDITTSSTSHLNGSDIGRTSSSLASPPSKTGLQPDGSGGREPLKTTHPSTRSGHSIGPRLKTPGLRSAGYEALLERDLGDVTQPLLRDNAAFEDDSDAMNDDSEVELQPASVSERDSEAGGATPTIEDIKEAVREKTENEASWSIAIQVFIPFLIAGLGMVGAGMVLDIVQHWDVFVNVSEVFILVPALLGLKGNLEMTLASRLSTQANIGNMDSREEQWKMIAGNMALTQAQAIVVGFLASCAAMIFGWIPQGKFNIQHGLLLCASSVLTAAIASFVLGTIMVIVVLLSRRCKVNPDNVATPIAASLGDLTTLALLAGISHGLYNAIDNQVWIAPVLLSIFLLLVPVWCYVSLRNHYVAEVIYTGWTPVICAMVISSIGGLILDFTVSNYTGIAVFQPVINGVGGNLVAVQASRLSTGLHRLSTPGIMPEGHQGGCPNPFHTFFGKGLEPRTVRVLLLLVIPGHLIFMYTISYMKAGHTSITLAFAIAYLTAALLQVALLLYIASWMVHYLWRKGDDPDNCAIPYLTALGDLLGTGLLAIAFHILYMIGDRDMDVGD